MSNSGNKWMTQAAMVSSIGLLVLVSTFIGMFFGNWLDGKLHTKPWLALVFTILGLAAGIYESAKILLAAIRDD